MVSRPRHLPVLLLTFCIPALCLLPACSSDKTTTQTRLAPNTGDLTGMRGDDMPPNESIPMPSNWKGFKAY